MYLGSMKRFPTEIGIDDFLTVGRCEVYGIFKECLKKNISNRSEEKCTTKSRMASKNSVYIHFFFLGSSIGCIIRSQECGATLVLFIVKQTVYYIIEG